MRHIALRVFTLLVAWLTLSRTCGHQRSKFRCPELMACSDVILAESDCGWASINIRKGGKVACLPASEVFVLALLIRSPMFVSVNAASRWKLEAWLSAFNLRGVHFSGDQCQTTSRKKCGPRPHEVAPESLPRDYGYSRRSNFV